MVLKRHLLSHTDGIVDQKYIDRSFDKTDSVGQRIVVKEKDVLSLVNFSKKNCWLHYSKGLQLTGAFTQAGQDNVTSTSNFYLASVNARRQVLTQHALLHFLRVNFVNLGRQVPGDRAPKPRPSPMQFVSGSLIRITC